MAKRKPRLIVYHVGVTLLTLISVGTVLLLLMGWGNATAEMAIINGLLVVFAIDYVARLALAKNRKIFLVQSAFDLLGIIPLHPVFAFFRLGRLVRLIRYHHLFWRLRINSKWTRAYHQFIYKTGFIYLFPSVTIIVSVPFSSR